MNQMPFPRGRPVYTDFLRSDLPDARFLTIRNPISFTTTDQLAMRELMRFSGSGAQACLRLVLDLRNPRSGLFLRRLYLTSEHDNGGLR
jgi:hypothetical protein